MNVDFAAARIVLSSWSIYIQRISPSISSGTPAPYAIDSPIRTIAGSSLSRNFRRFSGEASSVVIRLLGVVNLAFTQRLVLARTGYDWKLEAELPLVIAGLA